MRLPPNPKAVSPLDRREELRKARVAAPKLREACPNVALVRVELAFQTDAQPAHAPQAFSIYPPAKAHFVYACPFGSCDGSYDLNEITFSALQAGKRNMRGTLTCAGHRLRHGKAASPCELTATYLITVRHENPKASVSAQAAVQP